MKKRRWRFQMSGGQWPWVGARLAPKRWRSALLIAVGLVFVLLPYLGEFGRTLVAQRPGSVAIEVHPQSELQRRWLLSRAEDVWSEVEEGNVLTVVVDPADLPLLRARSISFEIVVADIHEVARQERARLQAVEANKPEDWFAEYKNVDAVERYLDRLVAEFPQLATVEVLGRSIEGRPIRALRIAGNGAEHKAILLNGGQHAREWISVMVTMCVADRLVRRYTTDESVRAIVDQSEFFVVPMANPDGYHYSWEADRYWRKNRRGGYGVDLNRNYSVAWGGAGSSKNRRSQIFRGDGPLSEPEAQALAGLFEREKIRAHLDFHSFGQLLLHPWSHQKGKAPEHDKLAALADRIVTAMYAAHGERYRLLPAEKLYAASGTLMDWAYGEHGALSYVVELRPKKGKGFVLPPQEIVPTCDESFAGVLELAKFVGLDEGN